MDDGDRTRTTSFPEVHWGPFRPRGHRRHEEHSIDEFVVEAFVIIGHCVKLVRAHRDPGRVGVEPHRGLNRIDGAHGITLNWSSFEIDDIDSIIPVCSTSKPAAMTG